MKINMVKQAGGVLVPASDMDAESLNKFKTGAIYPVELKRFRNPDFHGKVFKFFQFCFEHWSADKTHWDNMSEAGQFDSFRKELTKLAGFTVTNYSIDGKTFVVEAKSLSFGSMDQEEFEACYSALINAAIKHVFGDVNDERILNRLQSFF